VSIFKNKIVWIFSQQNWNGLKVSKHHYAETLADAGAKVYYFNPPKDSGWKIKKAKLSIDNSSNVNVVSQQFFFPINLKFHLRFLYNQLIKIQLKILRKNLPSPDFVWSFDLSNNFPLINFNSSINIFHPVDNLITKSDLKSSSGAHIIFSVTNEILKSINNNVPKYLINHGLNKDFLHYNSTIKKGNYTRVGLSGNLLRNDIDRYTLKNIILNYPNILFEIWGNSEYSNGIYDFQVIEFINFLNKQNNVKMHGIVTTKKLAYSYQYIDAFLICYDIRKDHSKGTNYHKVIEFLSTGKVVISNNISFYKDKKDLIEMSNNIDNSDMLNIFDKVINNLSFYNSVDKINLRKKFAFRNSYTNNLREIEMIITNVTLKK
jgi:hypothetical protein